jgi:bla regulator protein blaR1
MNAPLALTALINGAWQALLLCILVKLALRSTKRLNAATLYVVWCVVLGVSVLLPFANYRFAAAPHVVAAQSPSMATAVHERQAPSGSPVAVALRKSHALARSETHPGVGLIATGRETAIGFAVVALRNAPLLLLLLLLGASAMLALVVRDLFWLAKARSGVTPFAPPFAVPQLSRRAFSLVSSQRIGMPCVLGIWKPLLVVPETLADSGGANLRSVILHEQAHVARFDDWQHLLQRMIAAIFFFNPAVYIAAREMALTREQACDDAAAAHVDDRWTYAATLSSVVTSAAFRNAVVPGMALRKSDIARRIEALVDSACNHSVRINRRLAIAAALAMALVATVGLRYQLPVFAQETSAITRAIANRAICLPCGRKPVVAVAVRSVPHVRLVASVHAVKPTHPSPPRSPLRQSLSQGPARAAVRAALTAAKAKIAGVAAAPARAAPAALIAVVVRPVVVRPVVARPFVVRPVVVRPTVAGSKSGRVDFLDTLQKCGLRNLSVDQLIALRNHGVDSSLIESAVQYGIRNLSVESLVSLADHGVSAEYLGNLARYGLRNMDASAIVSLVDSGVSSRYAAEMSREFGMLPARTLVNMANHGVSVRLVSDARARHLTIDPGEAIEMADHGVSVEYVYAVKRSVFKKLTIDQVIRLRDQGFEPSSSTGGGQR